MKIISAFPGCGKTTFVSKFPNVADSDSSQFSKDNFPANYITHIRDRYDRGLTTLVSTHKVVRDALVAAKLPFTLVYPEHRCKQEYIDRYLNRTGFNGGEKFAELIADNWDQWIAECGQQNDCVKIQLKPGQFLSDDETQNDHFQEGKYVFYGNRVFIIAHSVRTHYDLQDIIKASNFRHAQGAGFITVNPDQLSLYGRSISLDDLRPRYDQFDGLVIAAHFGLVPHLRSSQKERLVEYGDFTFNKLPDQYRALYETEKVDQHG